jgi:hypothetical protein
MAEMRYPNRRQWWVIWIGAILAFLFLANGYYAVALGSVALTALLAWAVVGVAETTSSQ